MPADADAPPEFTAEERHEAYTTVLDKYHGKEIQALLRVIRARNDKRRANDA